MKIVLSVDTIFPPLTGIGRYALQLAQGLPLLPDVEAIRYISTGRWVFDLQSMANECASSAEIRLGTTARLRRYLAARTTAVKVYTLVMPPLMKWRMRHLGDYLYHSPNYFVPPFSGRSIATVHDLSNYRYPELHPAARRLYFDSEFPKTLQRVTHLITDSEAVRKEVAEFFSWPLERVTAIPLGVEKRFRPMDATETHSVLTPLGLKHDGYGLCVSTLEPRKRIDQLIYAYERLPPRCRTNYPLVIVGSRGWLSAALHDRISAARRQGWLHYLGYVAEQDLPCIFAGARGFFYPSLYEGFGLPVLEAMSAGVPVLTSDISSLPEVAGSAGLLVNPENLDALAEGVFRVLDDEQWRAFAKPQGLRRASNYTWERCIRQTADLYRRILTESA
ncbi:MULTISPECIES: glycosyltransferase family 4 protein [Thiorhodovibrio]|uniref:glycosyltransferase family 4 protein n=1 Tax=Thiorhodovibrio TaxID=61593 RepID=UPI001913E77D|nr:MULTISPECIES: glycosyltransferase family 1 protein [Thiorhodovibrio]MBK5970624.1 hypothetical protein [Thiorhodovibrio winogradskyi]WPL12752.1 Glycogen synthase [Thiorhodovibrio litoralis]